MNNDKLPELPGNVTYMGLAELGGYWSLASSSCGAAPDCNSAAGVFAPLPISLSTAKRFDQSSGRHSVLYEYHRQR